LIPDYSARGKREVWLTFDDGPRGAHDGNPSTTEAVLKTLDKYKIKATFFVVGENVARFPNIVRRTFDAGHRVGNHTYTHPYLTKLSSAAVTKQIADTDSLIAPYQASGSKIFRPPFGDHNPTVVSIVLGLGYRTILWDVDTRDWDRQYQPDAWMQLGIDGIRKRAKSKVLNHDIHPTTAAHLDEFIRRIVALGDVVFPPPSEL
jgi:peptidoglycan/xylan/chitin deacetylase (PgdA/CDA1 family)